MFSLRSAQGRAILAGAVLVVAVAGIATLAGMTAAAGHAAHSAFWLVIGFGTTAFAATAGVAAPAAWRAHDERKRAEEALRESEERFRTLSGATFEGIAVHDKGKILDANETYATMFGYNLPEVIGMHALDFAAPGSRDLVWQAIDSGRQEPFEAIGLRKDGSTFVGEVSGKAIPYKGRMVTVAAIRDITERKRAEEALRKVREDIESRVERRMQEVNGYGLTFRELTILHLVTAGESDKEIATALGISPLTAHKHLANILDKMGATSRTEAGVRALKEGLLD